jgi:hypothetical protein
MSENELAGAPAPEQAPTAEPAAVTDNSTPEPTPTEATKTFTQEELDAIVGKRLAREQRKWEREQAQKLKATPPAPPPEPLKPDNFADAQAYADAMAERKAQELLAKREAEAEQAAMLEAYQDREEEARNKYDDFEQVAYNPKLPVTETMAQTIQASEIGPDVIYWLGSNPKEAERIARLNPLLQAREIGRIEAKIASNPPAKKTSTAPAPIAPVTARTASGTPAYDTTDPRSVKNMSTSEWIEQERLRQIKKYEAQRRK